MTAKSPLPPPAADAPESPRQIHLPAEVSRLLSREETAFALGVNLRTVARLIDAGDIEVVRIGKLVRISPGALARFVNAREGRANPRKQKGKAKR